MVSLCIHFFPSEPVDPLARAGLHTPPQELSEAPPPPSLYPVTVELRANNGDTLIHILQDTGVTYADAHQTIEALRKTYDPKKLGVGQQLFVTLDQDAELPGQPVISKLMIPISVAETVEIARQEGEMRAELLTRPVSRTAYRAGGTIKSSMYQTALDAGVPATLVQEIINAYSYDVDFQRDIQPGDRIDVLFDRLVTDDGSTAGHGNVTFASLVRGGKDLRIYRFADARGRADYYNERGESVRKALLRTPMNGARISSGFGMRRHPILGYSKMHRGVDFAAPAGTPIYAAGDGVIEFAGTKGGYGNYVKLRHEGKYATAYAHLSRFGKIKRGQQVRQGQVIGYVGTTGRSTGPHLHYEILAGSVQVNPSGVKFKTGKTLAGKELAAFKEQIRRIETQLAAVPSGNKTEVAMSEEDR